MNKRLLTEKKDTFVSASNIEFGLWTQLQFLTVITPAMHVLLSPAPTACHFRLLYEHILFHVAGHTQSFCWIYVYTLDLPSCFTLLSYRAASTRALSRVSIRQRSQKHDRQYHYMADSPDKYSKAIRGCGRGRRGHRSTNIIYTHEYNIARSTYTAPSIIIYKQI